MTKVFAMLVMFTATTVPINVKAQDIKYANPTPGVCLLARADVIANSSAARYGSERMKLFLANINAELEPDRQAIQQEQNALRAAQNTLPRDQLNQRLSALQARAQNFTRLEQVRAGQLQATKAQVEKQIGDAIGPAAAPIIANHRCSVVLERASALGWNSAMDLTPEVMAEVNRRLPSIQFNLAPPPSQGR